MATSLLRPASTRFLSNRARSSKAKVAFISGPLAPGPNYFNQHYESRIKEAINSSHSFVIGPARGIDSEALRFLINQAVEPTRITIYLAQFQERSLSLRFRWFVNKGGIIKVEGDSMTERDAAMTRDSDYDILRYMTVEEQMVLYGDKYRPRVSGTEKNERRRNGSLAGVVTK